MAATPSLDPSAVEQLRAGMRGALLAPGDDGYDAARTVWNGMIDRRPALIARCAGAADVIAAVRFGRANDLLVSVRGGGHNVTGNAVCDGGLMIDLTPMKGVVVDPVARTAKAQGGVTWGEFDHETQAFGLATTGGQVSSTGIAGLTLGGGVGWLMRSFGAAVDNLLSVDLVLADGSFVTASASENEDLFWALRGGGGNFGIATALEYRLHPLGPIVFSGLTLYPFQQAPAVLRFLREYMATAPDAMMAVAGLMTAPPAPFVPPDFQGQKAIAIAVCYAGSVEEGARVAEPIRSFQPPVVDLLGPMPYTAVQQMFDAGLPFGQRAYLKSNHLTGLSDEVIDLVLGQFASVTSPISQIVIIPAGGAISRVGEHDTAFGHRTAPWDVHVYTLWLDAAEDERHIAWARSFGDAIQPYSVGVYVNELGVEGEARVRAAYPAATYDRLAALKAKYDPANFFHMNQNIRPG